MDLAKKYIRGIYRKFDKLPVYYPGSLIKVGDILSFPGNKPLGEPNGIYGNLREDYLRGEIIEVYYDNGNLPYNFITNNEVSLEVSGSASAPNLGAGELKFSFSTEGATVLIAEGVNSEGMSDLRQLQSVINLNSQEIDWNNKFVVTEVETARKALIFQSETKNAELLLKANIENLEIAGEEIYGLDAEIDFRVIRQSGASFIIPWMDNITVFMKLNRVKRNGRTSPFKNKSEFVDSYEILETYSLSEKLDVVK